MAAKRTFSVVLTFLLIFSACFSSTVYAVQYDLTTTVNISQGGTVLPDCITQACWYESGTKVSLVAVPNSGYVFDKWEVDCTGTSPSALVTMTGDKTCTANFSPCLDLPIKL